MISKSLDTFFNFITSANVKNRDVNSNAVIAALFGSVFSKRASCICSVDAARAAVAAASSSAARVPDADATALATRGAAAVAKEGRVVDCLSFADTSEECAVFGSGDEVEAEIDQP